MTILRANEPMEHRIRIVHVLLCSLIPVLVVPRKRTCPIGAILADSTPVRSMNQVSALACTVGDRTCLQRLPRCLPTRLACFCRLTNRTVNTRRSAGRPLAAGCWGSQDFLRRGGLMRIRFLLCLDVQMVR